MKMRVLEEAAWRAQCRREKQLRDDGESSHGQRRDLKESVKPPPRCMGETGRKGDNQKMTTHPPSKSALSLC